MNKGKCKMELEGIKRVTKFNYWGRNYKLDQLDSVMEFYICTLILRKDSKDLMDNAKIHVI